MPLLPPPLIIILNIIQLILYFGKVIRRCLRRNEQYVYTNENAISGSQILRNSASQIKVTNKLRANVNAKDKIAMANIVEKKMTSQVLDNLGILDK
jgi:hypothetical protein